MCPECHYFFSKGNALYEMEEGLRNRHAGGACKTLIGAPGKSWGAECIRKGEKNRQLRVAELNESDVV